MHFDLPKKRKFLPLNTIKVNETTSFLSSIFMFIRRALIFMKLRGYSIVRSPLKPGAVFCAVAS